MKKIFAGMLILVMLCSSVAFAESIVADFANPDIGYAPGVRWELPLGNTTDEELIRELESLYEAGFGVVEVTATGQPTGSIPEGYAHAGEDYAAVYGMGSYEWSRSLQTILRKANELGMRVDYHVSVNNGSNKHIPGISPNDEIASKEIISIAASAAGSLPDMAAITPEAKTFVSNVDGSEQLLDQNFYAALLVNVVEKGKTVEMLKTMDGSVVNGGGYGEETFEATIDVLDFDSIVDVTALYSAAASGEDKAAAQTSAAAVDLSSGTWEVIAFWWRGDCTTITKVTQYPSYKINYFNLDATIALMDYYKNEIFRFDQEGFEDMRGLIAENGGNIFADSYGANANWANELPALFEEVAGESIVKYLPALVYATGAGRRGSNTFGYYFSDGSQEDVKATIMECMTQLLVENQLKPMCEMCAEIGLEYRDQVVYATSRLDLIEAAAYVDIAEGESLNMVDSPDYFTAMASSAHLLDKEIVSTEHGATFGDTLGTFAHPISLLIRQANRIVQGGVNQYIIHYYDYNDLDYPDTVIAQWPGFTAMGSRWGSWRDNMPEWDTINIMTAYFSRLGEFMRQGVVKRDVVVYKESYWWPRHVRLFWVDEALQDAGYTYDFISGNTMSFDKAVVTDGVLAADTAGYKAIIFNADGKRDAQDVAIDEISLKAIEKFAEYAQAGLPIVMVGSYPTGLFEMADADEQARFESALATLKSLDNVVLVDTEAEVPAALQALGVDPDAENMEATRITSYHTQDDGIDYYYLYNQSNNYFQEMDFEFTNSAAHYGNTMDEGYTAATQVALTGEGVPYLFDLYSGEVSRIADYAVDELGRIVLDVELVKDQAMLIGIASPDLLDDGMTGSLSGTVDNAALVYADGGLAVRATESGEYTVMLSDGSQQTVTADVSAVESISPWSLSILSYTNKNDLGVTGAAAAEMAYTVVGDITLDSLASWVDLGTVTATVTMQDGTVTTQDVDLGTLSGIGTYTATLVLPDSWSAEDGLYINLGDPYDLVIVFVNGVEIPTVDQVGLTADIGAYVQPGENLIVIETNTSLSNALVVLRPDWYGTTRVNQYGLCEEVTFTPYVDVALN